MATAILSAPTLGNRAALLLTLSNLEQAARHAAKALLMAEAQPSKENALVAILDGIQRKADAIRVIQCGGVA